MVVKEQFRFCGDLYRWLYNDSFNTFVLDRIGYDGSYKVIKEVVAGDFRYYKRFVKVAGIIKLLFPNQQLEFCKDDANRGIWKYDEEEEI